MIHRITQHALTIAALCLGCISTLTGMAATWLWGLS